MNLIVGHGHFGTVRLATLPTSHLHFAIKSIEKAKIKKDLKYLKRELILLKNLDHPNIIKFFETFQDEKFIYFVMECCSGGELLDRISKRGHLSEKEVAVIMEKALSAVRHLHSLGIVHRDIKPENFMFTSKNDDAELKLIDFGLSKYFGGNPTAKLSSMVGTPLYVAPEVLEGTYDERCDNWSLGVVMYYLLSGYLPFDDDTVDDIFKKIKRGKVVFEGKGWSGTSSEVRDLIRKLLKVDPDDRLTASEALNHPWFKMNLDKRKKKINPIVIEKLKTTRMKKKFQNEILKVIVNHLSEDEIKELRENFRAIDKNNTGFISIEELTEALKSDGKVMSKQDIEALMAKMHINHKDNTINYSEFLANTLDKKVYYTHEKLWDAFKHFDIDNTGEITIDDLKEAFAREGRQVSRDDLVQIIKEVDPENKGSLNFHDFKNLMKIGEDSPLVQRVARPINQMNLSLSTSMSKA